MESRPPIGDNEEDRSLQSASGRTQGGPYWGQAEDGKAGGSGLWEPEVEGPPWSRPGRYRREAGRAAGAAGPRAPASRSTSPSRCRPGRRTPHSPAPRPPRARPLATPRAPAPPGSRLDSRLRPSSTVTELRCATQAEAGKVSSRGGVRRRGLSTRQPIPRKETGRK